MAQITILPTENKLWGFWGTMLHEGLGMEAAWELTFSAVHAATRASEDGVRGFLDSRDGRHFADEVRNFLAAGLPLDGAIQAAVNRWMGWSISRKTARETGIPVGLPYLTGWVTHYEIMADAA
jgi:hypothetical protein